MFLSENGRDAIKAFEGLYLKAYRCPAGVWTIGWGSTEGVYEGMTITTAMAERLLDAELAKFVTAVNRLVKVPLSQHQFDALVSFAYNVGVGALERSTLLKKLNAGDYDAVPAQLARWTHGGGRVLPGLVKRRKAEGDMWRAPGVRVEPIKEPMAQRTDAPIGEFSMPAFLISLITGVIGQLAGGLSQPEQKPGAGVTVPSTITNTNFLQGIIGALFTAFGAQSFGVDFFHTVATVGGALVTISAWLNQNHITSSSNANTLALIGQLLAQIGAAAQKETPNDTPAAQG